MTFAFPHLWIPKPLGIIITDAFDMAKLVKRGGKLLKRSDGKLAKSCGGCPCTWCSGGKTPSICRVTFDSVVLCACGLTSASVGDIQRRFNFTDPIAMTALINGTWDLPCSGESFGSCGYSRDFSGGITYDGTFQLYTGNDCTTTYSTLDALIQPYYGVVAGGMSLSLDVVGYFSGGFIRRTRLFEAGLVLSWPHDCYADRSFTNSQTACYPTGIAPFGDVGATGGTAEVVFL